VSDLNFTIFSKSDDRPLVFKRLRNQIQLELDFEGLSSCDSVRTPPLSSSVKLVPICITLSFDVLINTLVKCAANVVASIVCADTNPDFLSDSGVQIELVYTAICSLAENCSSTDRRLEVSAEVEPSRLLPARGVYADPEALPICNKLFH
jgi:hypothetical protein